MAATTPLPESSRARSKTTSSDPVQTWRGGSPSSNTTISEEYPPRPDPREGARRGVETLTVTSGFERSSSSVGEPPRAGFAAVATTGTEIGSAVGDAMSAAPAAAQTRPLESAVIAVISGFPES